MKKFLSAIIFIALLFFTVKTSFASEGTFELRSTDNNNYKCFAASLQQQNLVYKILVSCRNIVFPVNDTIYTYIMWANPKDGSAAVKLGSIGLGRAEFATAKAFTSLFVTAEQNPGVRTPTGPVVMKGSIIPVSFLEKPQPTQTPAEEGGSATVETPTPTPSSSVRDRLLTGLKRAGLASGLALIAILGLVFVLTRPR